MTELSLDHVLIAVHDLQAASKTYSETLGFALMPEGIHPGRGTHNRNIVLGQEYVELIAIRVPAEREGSPLKHFLDRREGMYAFALGVKDIGAFVSELHTRSVEVEEPRKGSLSGQPGKVGYTWRSAYVSPEATPGARVLLVQHDKSIEERYTEPANLHIHPNGVLGVQRLGLAVRDAVAAASRWERNFGVKISQVKEMSPSATRHALIPLQNCCLEFVSPLKEGELSRFLDLYGPGLYFLALKVQDMEATKAFLKKRGVPVGDVTQSAWGKTFAVPPSHTHGVVLEIVQPQITD